MLSLVAASLAFSLNGAPLTRRDMMMGMGAAVVATGPMPAFAKGDSAKERDAKLQETLAALDFKLDPAVKALQATTYNPNGVNTFTPTGSNRKPSDPNLKKGDKDAFMKKYGY